MPVSLLDKQEFKKKLLILKISFLLRQKKQNKLIQKSVFYCTKFVLANSVQLNDFAMFQNAPVFVPILRTSLFFIQFGIKMN